MGSPVLHARCAVKTSDVDPTSDMARDHLSTRLRLSLSIWLRPCRALDHLLNNPYLQPPLPSDWEVRPTYPRHATVPYNLAPLWDEGGLSRRVAAAAAARQSERRKRQIDNATTGIPAVTGTGTVTSRRTMSKIGGDRATTTTGEAKIKVAKDLRERLKRARAARGTLRDLEEDIRAFIQEWTSPRYGGDRIAGQEMVEEQPDDGELVSLEEEDSLFSEDEEIVYVGRKGQMHGGGPIKETHLTSPGHGILTTGDERDYGSGDLPTDKLVLDTPADDRNASFRYVLPYPGVSVELVSRCRDWLAVERAPPGDIVLSSTWCRADKFPADGGWCII